MVSLLMLFLWYNPVSARSFFNHSFVSRGSHQGRHDFGGAVALGMFRVALSSRGESTCEQSRTGEPFGLNQS